MTGAEGIHGSPRRPGENVDRGSAGERPASAATREKNEKSQQGGGVHRLRASLGGGASKVRKIHRARECYPFRDEGVGCRGKVCRRRPEGSSPRQGSLRKTEFQAPPSCQWRVTAIFKTTEVRQLRCKEDPCRPEVASHREHRPRQRFENGGKTRVLRITIPPTTGPAIARGPRSPTGIKSLSP